MNLYFFASLLITFLVNNWYLLCMQTKTTYLPLVLDKSLRFRESMFWENVIKYFWIFFQMILVASFKAMKSLQRYWKYLPKIKKRKFFDESVLLLLPIHIKTIHPSFHFVIWFWFFLIRYSQENKVKSCDLYAGNVFNNKIKCHG